jgi:hypothetical protein
MSAQADRTFLARDVYRDWKKRVQAATESVVIFGPYLDSLLDRLLKSSELDVGAITVVTDLSPASGTTDYRAQLIGVRALIRRGIHVRSIPRLHAKVLLCDWRTVTIGSQNFTSYARGSRETTAVPADDVSESKFLTTLREWFDLAVPVDQALVERLLAGLDGEMKAFRHAQAALVASYEQLREAHERELERQRQLEEDRRRREQAERLAPIGVRLTAAVREARQRLARPTVLAELKERSQYDEYGEVDYTYWTLRTDSVSDLTRWLKRPPGQTVEYRALKRLFMYPLILSDSGRMGFARVGRQQISYVRNAVNNTAAETVAGMKYRLYVECPDEDLETANLHITLRPESARATAAVKLLVQFDGSDKPRANCEIVRHGTFSTYVPGAGRYTLSADEVAATFANPEHLYQVMHFALASFKYEELGIYGQNAEKFFPSGRLLVTLLEYAGQPVLAVSPSA